jgi:hypothetical protein
MLGGGGWHEGENVIHFFFLSHDHAQRSHPLTPALSRRLTGQKEAEMKTALMTLAAAALLAVPVSSFAHDYDRYDRWRSARSRVVERFEREHPRWPRVYCHTHRYPLHPGDTREHCHNWNRDSWELARYRWTGYGGRQHSHYQGWRRDRHDDDRYRRHWRWGRDRD